MPSVKTKKRPAAKKTGKKKRWSSGSFRSCGFCGRNDHNIRSCKAPGAAGFRKKRAKKK